MWKNVVVHRHKHKCHTPREHRILDSGDPQNLDTRTISVVFLHRCIYITHVNVRSWLLFIYERTFFMNHLLPKRWHNHPHCYTYFYGDQRPFVYTFRNAQHKWTLALCPTTRYQTLDGRSVLHIIK